MTGWKSLGDAISERTREDGSVVPFPSKASDFDSLHSLACIPSRYRKCTREAWEGDAHSVDEWDGQPWCLLLSGPVGTGKTHLGTAVYQRLASVRHGCWWLGASDFLSRLQRAYDSDKHSASGFVSAMCNAPVLLLDDLGREHLTPWSRDQLSHLLRTRFDWERPTIVTTNHNEEGLKKWDAAVKRRLYEDSKRVVLARRQA